MVHNHYTTAKALWLMREKSRVCSADDGYRTPYFSFLLVLRGGLLTLGAHARGLQYLSCLSVCVCVCVCVFSLFWHLAQSGVQTAVSATSA